MERYSFSLLPKHFGCTRGLSIPSRLRPGLSGLTSEIILLRIFSVAISVSPHVCFILDLILISMFLR